MSQPLASESLSITIICLYISITFSFGFDAHPNAPQLLLTPIILRDYFIVGGDATQKGDIVLLLEFGGQLCLGVGICFFDASPLLSPKMQQLS